MAHTYTRLLVHVVFGTKDRLPQIDAGMKPRLLAYLGGIAAELGAVQLAGNGVADHVHLLVSLPSTLSVAELMRVLKANSSRWVHETWPNRPFAWQAGYGAFSVSESNVGAVREYIANQEEHHRTVTFQEEYRAFLRKHNIEFDDRYLWD